MILAQLKSHVKKYIENYYLNKKNSVFLTIHKRPVYARNIQIQSDPYAFLPKTAIMMQGPLTEQNDFTLETLKLYHNIFPNSTLILSTWNDAPRNLLDKIKDLGVEIVLSNQPENSGISNINYQIISTLNGIIKAKAMGCQYVCKTRTDQRMYAANIMEYLFSLLQTFPINMNTTATERIITINLNTFKNRFYGVTDMWSFGYIEDMLTMWNIPLDTRISEELNLFTKENHMNITECSKLRICESYITSQYFENLGFSLTWTLEDSLFYYSNLFIIIDKESLDLIWPKYGIEEYKWLMYSPTLYTQINFKDWLILYHKNSSSNSII